MSEKRCEYFDEIVEEVMRRMTQRKPVDAKTIQNAVYRGMMAAIESSASHDTVEEEK